MKAWHLKLYIITLGTTLLARSIKRFDSLYQAISFFRLEYFMIRIVERVEI
jgi:hypothetical protein